MNKIINTIHQLSRTPPIGQPSSSLKLERGLTPATANEIIGQTRESTNQILSTNLSLLQPGALAAVISDLSLIREALLQAGLDENTISANSLINSMHIAHQVANFAKAQYAKQAAITRTDSYKEFSTAAMTGLAVTGGELYSRGGTEDLDAQLKNLQDLKTQLSDKSAADVEMTNLSSPEPTTQNVQKLIVNDDDVCKNAFDENDAASFRAARPNESERSKILAKHEERIQKQRDAVHEERARKRNLVQQQGYQFGQNAIAGTCDTNNATLTNERGSIEAAKTVSEAAQQNARSVTDTASQAKNTALQILGEISRIEQGIVDANYSFRG